MEVQNPYKKQGDWHVYSVLNMINSVNHDTNSVTCRPTPSGIFAGKGSTSRMDGCFSDGSSHMNFENCKPEDINIKKADSQKTYVEKNVENVTNSSSKKITVTKINTKDQEINTTKRESNVINMHNRDIDPTACELSQWKEDKTNRYSHIQEQSTVHSVYSNCENDDRIRTLGKIPAVIDNYKKNRTIDNHQTADENKRQSNQNVDSEYQINEEACATLLDKPVNECTKSLKKTVELYTGGNDVRVTDVQDVNGDFRKAPDDVHQIPLSNVAHIPVNKTATEDVRPSGIQTNIKTTLLGNSTAHTYSLTSFICNNLTSGVDEHVRTSPQSNSQSSDVRTNTKTPILRDQLSQPIVQNKSQGQTVHDVIATSTENTRSIHDNIDRDNLKESAEQNIDEEAKREEQNCSKQGEVMHKVEDALNGNVLSGRSTAGSNITTKTMKTTNDTRRSHKRHHQSSTYRSSEVQDPTKYPRGNSTLRGMLENKVIQGSSVREQNYTKQTKYKDLAASHGENELSEMSIKNAPPGKCLNSNTLSSKKANSKQVTATVTRKQQEVDIPTKPSPLRTRSNHKNSQSQGQSETSAKSTKMTRTQKQDMLAVRLKDQELKKVRRERLRKKEKVSDGMIDEYFNWNADLVCPVCCCIMPTFSAWKKHFDHWNNCTEFFIGENWNKLPRKNLELFSCPPCDVKFKDFPTWSRHMFIAGPHGDLGSVAFPKGYLDSCKSLGKQKEKQSMLVREESSDNSCGKDSNDSRKQPNLSASPECEGDARLYVQDMNKIPSVSFRVGFFCKTCGSNNYGGTYEITAAVHIYDRHLRINTFPCRYCDKVLNSKKSHRIHELHEHIRTPSIKCEVCGSLFTSPSRLKRHSKIHEKAQPKVSCKVCGQLISQGKYMFQHIKRMHTDYKTTRRKCPVCGKDIRLYDYKRHVKSHTLTVKTKRTVCQVCGKSVTNLTTHFKQHGKSMEDRKSPCPICGVKVINLYTHLEYHKESRKYTCDICDKKFFQKHHLTTHMKGVHQNVRPFKCSICGFEFTLKHHLNSHIKTKHEILDKENATKKIKTVTAATESKRPSKRRRQ